MVKVLYEARLSLNSNKVIVTQIKYNESLESRLHSVYNCVVKKRNTTKCYISAIRKTKESAINSIKRCLIKEIKHLENELKHYDNLQIIDRTEK